MRPSVSICADSAWSEQRNTPIYEEAGHLIAMEGIARDITERKLAEEARRQNEEQYRLLAETTSDLVCLHKPGGRYLHISPSCRRLLGYEPEDLLGTDPYDLFHHEDLERIRTEAHEMALEGQEAVSVTYHIHKESAAYTWFETFTEPILGESGEVVRLQTSSRDVSEHNRAVSGSTFRNCYHDWWSSPESILVSLARGSLSCSAVIPTLG